MCIRDSFSAGDLTHAEPPVIVKKAEHIHFALPHRKLYPIDTPQQLKLAEGYFDEHLTELPLLDRRVFAQSMKLRGADLGVKVAGRSLEYSGEEYGPHIASELLARERAFVGTGHDAVYSVLRDKVAEVDPVIMVEMLKEADKATGADRGYGRPVTGFRDPYAAVYGGDKVASDQPTEEDSYSWTGGTDYVNGMQLVALSQNASEMLDASFGCLLYTSPSPRDKRQSRMPSSA